MNSLEKVARHYGQRAAPYALLARTGLWPPLLRQRAVRALALRDADHVLDVGCGTGASFSLLRRAVGPAGRIVAVDYVPEMLARARKYARESRAELVRAEAGRLPLRGEFDGALFCLSFFVIPEPFSALEQICSLLRPGGRVVIADGKYPVSLEGHWASRAAARAIARTRFEPLLRTRSLPALRSWFSARGSMPRWQEWWAGTFFVCAAEASG